MLFNSIDFVVFFPIVLIIYYCIPIKYKHLWLLLSSYYFYMNWNPAYGLLLFFCTFLTYAGGLFIEKIRKQENKDKSASQAKICLALCLCLNLGILCYFKYSRFLGGYFSKLISVLHVPVEINMTWTESIILPVGISFYILQSLGYLIDVYRKEIYAEKNFFRYALFVSFFPQLVAGPIERSKNLLVQLAQPQKLSWDNCKKGLFIMSWGFFLKLVIADRAAIFVDMVYENCDRYTGLYIVIATVLFAFQIYCDFYGYSIIAKGVSLFFGIRLMDNFDAPYFSKSVAEFWRRWHISLSGWFRDYLYIPLGGNRKGFVRKQINKMIVFAVSGLWHGASIAFIVWGALNGFYQVVADIVHRNRKANQSAGKILTVCKCLGTFLLICFAWLFFRAGDMSDALVLLRNMCCFNWEILVNGELFTLGISKEFFTVLIISIGILGCVDYLKYQKKDVVDILVQKKWWVQGIVIVMLVYAILVFGCYGVEYDTNQFIYFQF
ncbi:MAG: MBOAT family protein [Lachnospiraceae bacterium]|nr:MBOAT family protein [Lachnospiraceae bacterium]